MLTRWTDIDTTFAALDAFRRRMDRIFEDYNRFVGDEPRYELGTSWPHMVVSDEGNDLRVYAEVPGLSEKDIQLTLNQNVLTVSGERKLKVPEGYSAHRQERANYAFSKSITLPCEVNPEKASASVKDGILTVSVGKAEAAKPRQITVKAH